MTVDLPVLSAVLVALLVGFVLGRLSARGRADPSDVSRLRRQAGPGPSVAPSPAAAPAPSSEPLVMPPEVHAHLQNGALITAIKALKDANPGMGLKQAKDAVEAYARRNGLA